MGRSKRRVTDFYRLRSTTTEQGRKAKSLEDGSSVVIKSIEKRSLDFEDFKQIREQIEILYLCRSQPNITRLIEHFEDRKTFHLVFKPDSGITLKRYFFEEKKNIKPTALRAICKQLCSALDFLKKHNILHRNINPCSVFLTGKELEVRNNIGTEVKVPQIQLGDFSQATFLKQNEEANKVCGLATFVAPEVIQFHRYGYPVDMYSLGVTIYFVMTGKVPYSASRASLLYK